MIGKVKKIQLDNLRNAERNILPCRVLDGRKKKYLSISYCISYTSYMFDI